MSKIICDVCGTQYPESAEQCPICGRVRTAVNKPAADDFVMESTAESEPARVRGGRFSKANVRKRTQNAPHYEPQEERTHQSERNDEEDTYAAAPRGGGSDRVINVVLAIVIIALLAVSVYIFSQYLLPKLTGEEESIPETTLPIETTEPTEPETAVPTIPCTSLQIVDTNITLEDEGQMYLLNVAVTPTDTTDTLTFVSSDESIVTVNEEGRLTAVSDGIAVITITCGGETLECAVTCDFTDETEPAATETTPATEAETVPPTTAPLKDVTLSVKKTDVTFAVRGQQTTFKLTCDLEPTEVEWSSEDESIVTVDENGLATAVGKGKTNVVVKYGDQEVKIIVRCKW